MDRFRDAHEVLDHVGVPRKVGGGPILTLAARIEILAAQRHRICTRRAA